MTVAFRRLFYKSGRVGGTMVLSVLICSPVSAQFWEKLSNPQITVSVTYPPLTGLIVKRAAIARMTGNCAEEVAEKLTSAISSQVEVIERANLDSILKEQHLNLSEYVDASTAARLGKVLGSAVLVFIRANCRDYQQPLYETAQRNNVKVRINVSRTTVTLRGSVQVVDTETAKVFSQMPLEITEKVENRSEEGQPEFPLPELVLANATTRAASQATRLLVPWSEMEKVYFYDDKDCNLKAAYQTLKAGMIDQTLEVSAQNVRACESASFKNEKDRNKAVGKAYYNLGVAQMLKGQYDDAGRSFEKVVGLRGAGDIVNTAIARNNELKHAFESMRKTVEKTERLEESRTATASPPGAWSQQPSATSEQPGNAAGVGKSASGGGSMSPAERLRNLDKLLKEGLITKEEYDKKRAAILAEM